MKIQLRHLISLIFLGLVAAAACGENQSPTASKLAPGICTSDTDCSTVTAPHCDGFTGCVACVLDDHCGEGDHCESNQCVTPESCSSPTDCSTPGKSACNYILGECVECVLSGDCGDSAICEEGSCREVTACVNSLDCPDSVVCDRESGYCVDCIADGDCEETHACVANECVPRCESDKDCTAAGQLCSSAEYCVECVEHVDCPDLYHCSSGSCTVDVCLANQTECHENVDALALCNSQGSDTQMIECDYGSSCVDGPTEAACTDWACTPGSAVCDVTKKKLLTCEAGGQGGKLDTDCTALGGVCENNACADVKCEADKRFCDGKVVMQCNGTGTAFTSVQTCITSFYCDDDAGACVTNKCIPNTTTCDGNVIRTCNSDGSAWLAEKTDCTDAGEACYLGVCRTKTCDVGAPYCKVGNAYSCVNNGSSEQVVDYCKSTEYCSAGSCQLKACTENSPTCDGDTTGVCSSDGASIDTSAGTDCSSLLEVACYQGSCISKVCDPNGGTFCQDGGVRNCTSNGTSSTFVRTCSSSYYCKDTGAASCALKLCTAGSPACDSNRATTCNAEGSGYEAGGTVCSASELCLGGSCLPVICMANSYYCDSGNVMRCGSDGTTTQLRDTCSTSEYCQEGTSFCKTDVCTAGQPACDGALLATCNSDGSGPESDGVACASGKTCESGACKDVFCTPTKQYCEDNFQRTCNATGTGYSSSSTCSTIYFCDELTPGDTSCFHDLCAPGSNTCDGETLATCSSNGGSYEAQGTDCAASGKICDASACVDSLVESIGGTNFSTTNYCSNYRQGNRYTFTSSRSLTEIQHYLGISGTIQLTWVIYETTSALGTGSYTKVFEKLTTSTGTDYHSSGSINFTVEPGKYYMIGVRPAASCTSYYGGNSGKTYLSSGFAYYRDYESDSGTISTSWSLSVRSSAYAQKLTFE